MLSGYFGRYPEEFVAQRAFVEFVGRYDGGALYDRKNFDGHITAGAIILSRDRQKMLLLDHVQLRKWLQPGGHIDPEDESVLAAALREVSEETGLESSSLRQLFAGDGSAVIDIDSHPIGASEKKREGAHVHHDIRYVFVLENESAVLRVVPDESNGFRWVEIGQIPSHFGFDRIKGKLSEFE